MESLKHYIYFETQGNTQLCGVHCINSLLQGPYYNAITLAQIAQELDAKEKKMLEEQIKEGEEYVSQHVALDGNYSIEVLKQGMQKLGKIVIDSIESQTSKKMGDLSKQQAFICNSQSHWFTIRRINKIWYNLNSTNDLGPEIISDFYLSAFLNSVKENGYMIFVIKGNLPKSSQRVLFGNDLQKHQKFFTEEECQIIWQANKADKSYKLNIGGTDEKAMEKAMKESLQMYQQQQQQQQMQQFDYKEPKPKKKDNRYIYKTPGEGDPELTTAIKLSMECKFTECPDKSNGNVELLFVFPDKKQIKWIFEKTDKLEELFDFAYVKMSQSQNFSLKLNQEQNRQFIQNPEATIQQYGIQDKQVIYIVIS